MKADGEMPPKKKPAGAERSVVDLGIQLIKQYPGQEQVDLAVTVEVPGSWFGGTASGSLGSGERKEKYTGQAVEYAKVHEFPSVGSSRKSKGEGIRFVCLSDAQEQPDHAGFWMPLAQWNRCMPPRYQAPILVPILVCTHTLQSCCGTDRHGTYKDRRGDELPFILPVMYAQTLRLPLPDHLQHPPSTPVRKCLLCK